jgi:AcrR family transcriptional regulator
VSAPQTAPASERLPAAERRERILRAFREEALACGSIAGVGVRAVVERAGCTAPVLYRLFGDRAGLVRAAVASTHTDLIERLEAAARSGGSAVERLRELGREYLAREPGPAEAFEALVNVECQSDPALARRVGEVFARFEALLVATVRDGVRAGALRTDLDPEYVAWRLIDLGLFRNQVHLMRIARPREIDYATRALESLLEEVRA